MIDTQDPCQTARRQALLGELAEIGMALVRDLPRQAAEPDADSGAIILKYARVSRAVRQTLALQARFEQEGLERAARRATERGARRKREVERLVTQAIAAEFSEDEAEDLFSDLDTRLMTDPDADYADAPLALLAAQICRDLEVPFDAALWEDGDASFSVSHSCSSSPGLSQPSINTAPSGRSPPSAHMDGWEKSGHDKLELGDWTPSRPSG